MSKLRSKPVAKPVSKQQACGCQAGEPPVSKPVAEPVRKLALKRENDAAEAEDDAAEGDQA